MLKLNSKKKTKVVSDNAALLEIGQFSTPHSIYLNIGF